MSLGGIGPDVLVFGLAADVGAQVVGALGIVDFFSMLDDPTLADAAIAADQDREPFPTGFSFGMPIKSGSRGLTFRH
jgi:hypothetical protein